MNERMRIELKSVCFMKEDRSEVDFGLFSERFDGSFFSFSFINHLVSSPYTYSIHNPHAITTSIYNFNTSHYQSILALPCPSLNPLQS